MTRHTKAGRMFASVEHQVFGAAFLGMLVLFVWLTYAIFNKTFAEYDEVELRSSKTGLQLPSRADVKLRGVIVGEVLEATSTGEGAELTLGIYPSQTETIPANVSARILPKTLFGEKFVSLEVPESPAGESIAAGDVIEQTEVAIEVEEVLSDIYPLLRTVQPEQVNYTLTALATALEGRGDALGANFATLDSYLRRMNPQIPALMEDLRLLSDVSDTYAQVMPELARLLRNQVTTGRTFVEKEAKIEAFFSDVSSFSSTTRDFLQANGDNIIRLGELGQEQLPVFAKYSSVFPCFFDGIVKVAPRQAEAFRGFTLHINLETLPAQPRGFGPQDDPVFDDQRGPLSTELCRRVVADEWNQENLPPQFLVPDLDDGVDEDSGKGRSPNRPAPLFDLTSGLAGTRAEQDVVNSVAGPMLGVPTDAVPGLATLLLGPLARGAEVSLR